MSDVADIGHWYGSDLIVSNTGDLMRVERAVRSRQRVLRRLMTADGDYLAHPAYGAGLPSEVGKNLEAPRVRGLIAGEMLKERSVRETPPPRIQVTPIANGVRANIEYETAPGVRAVLAFDVSE